MSKTDRAKQRAKKKANKAAMPSLSKVPRPKKRGRERMAQIKGERGVDRIVLGVRCKLMGRDLAEMNAMREQMLGEDAGRAIWLGGGERKTKLWGTYARLTAAERTYAMRILGKGLDPKGAKVEMAPERVEARADDRPDLRSEDDRDRDAVNTWMHWRGLLGCLGAKQQTSIFDIVRGRKVAVEAGELTAAGHIFLAAMGNLQDILDS